MKDLRWLLVGAGDIAANRVGPALREAGNSELCAICDCDQGRAAELAARLGVAAVYADYDQALAECACDAVYIATPQVLHMEMCLKALAAGRHFLCEKPLGFNGAECRRILAAARATDRVVSCSNYRRLSAHYRMTEAMFRRGELGRLLGGWGVYSTPFYNPARHKMIRRSMGLSRIKELGFYLIDIVHNLFGMPSAVMAQAATVNREFMNDVEDVAMVSLKIPAGGIFTMVFECGAPGLRHEMEFWGDRARVQWRDWPPHGNGPVCRIARGGTESFAVPDVANWHLPMIEDYVGAVREGRAPVCTLESAVQTELITDAIFRAIQSGQAEPVAPLVEPVSATPSRSTLSL